MQPQSEEQKRKSLDTLRSLYEAKSIELNAIQDAIEEYQKSVKSYTMADLHVRRDIVRCEQGRILKKINILEHEIEESFLNVPKRNCFWKRYKDTYEEC